MKRNLKKVKKAPKGTLDSRNRISKKSLHKVLPSYLWCYDLLIKIYFHKSLPKELFSNEIIDPNYQIWRFSWSLNFYIVSETPMLWNQYFSGFFLRPTFANLLPKMLIFGIVWHRGKSVFNCFIEFLHLGVNNSWLIFKILRFLGTYWR